MEWEVIGVDWWGWCTVYRAYTSIGATCYKVVFGGGHSLIAGSRARCAQFMYNNFMSHVMKEV